MDRSIDINKIFQRRPAREFLSNYPTKLWNQIIPDVFEIGILNLKNSFNTLKFSRQEFENILFELRNYKPNEEENYSIEEEENSESNTTNTISNNEISINSNQSINKTGKQITTARAEVFIPDIKEIERNIPKIHPRRPYYTTMDDIKEQNRENNRNLNYVESKIRAQVLNDKMIHKAIKTQKNVNRNNQRDIRQRNNNVNYAMSFDKNLKMEQISKKENSNNSNYYNNNSNNNISGNNFNTFNNSGNNYDNSNNNMSTNNNYDNSNYDNMNNNINQDYLQRSGDSNYYNNNNNENNSNLVNNKYNNTMAYQNEMSNSNYNNEQEGNLNYNYMNDSEIINNNNIQGNNNLVNNVYNNNEMNNTNYNDM
jgi:hypothetical protein